MRHAVLSLCLMGFASSQEQGGMEARVRELLEDVQDGVVAHAADVELRALGTIATRDLVRLALADPRQRFAALPYLRASQETATVALEAVLARLSEIGEPEAAHGGRPSRTQIEQRAALDLAEALVPWVPEGATVCAALLARADASPRLRLRGRFSPRTEPRELAKTLQRGELAEVEAALELLARHGRDAAGVCARPLLDLWDARDELLRRTDDHALGVDRGDLHAALAAALLAVVPDDERAADACVELLGTTRSMPVRLDSIQRLGALGEAAARAVPILQNCLYAFDDGLARAALDALAALGPVAAPALPAVEERATTAQDGRTRLLAQLARARVAPTGGEADRIDGLVAELAHPTRWRSARTELLRLGRPAAARLLASFGEDTEPITSSPSFTVDLLHDLGAAARDAAREVLAQPPAGFAHATWLQRRVAVDLLGDDPEPAAAALRAWPGGDDDVVVRTRALQERLTDLARLGEASSDDDLVAALRSGSDAVAERAARVSARRPQVSDAVHAALVARLAREEPLHASNHDALRHAGFARHATAARLCTLPAPPPDAFARLVADLPRGPGLELVQRAMHFAWSPADAAAGLGRLLDSADEDLQIAAAETLARSSPAARLAREDLDRASRFRGTRALRRALAQAVDAARRE